MGAHPTLSAGTPSCPNPNRPLRTRPPSDSIAPMSLGSRPPPRRCRRPAARCAGWPQAWRCCSLPVWRCGGCGRRRHRSHHPLATPPPRPMSRRPAPAGRVRRQPALPRLPRGAGPAVAAIAPRAGDGRAQRRERARRLQQCPVQASGRDLALLQARRQVLRAHRRARRQAGRFRDRVHLRRRAAAAIPDRDCPAGGCSRCRSRGTASASAGSTCCPPRRRRPATCCTGPGATRPATRCASSATPPASRSATTPPPTPSTRAGRSPTCRASRATARASGTCSGRSCTRRARPRPSRPASATA